MCVLGWFINTILETQSYEQVSTKRHFFLMYFVALPIIVLVTSFLSPWVREKTMGAMTTSVHCFIYLSLIYMLWPTRTPRYFERLYSVSSPSEKASLRDQHLPTEEL
ncbi:hypothetical protein PI124_g15346 [Phytophthora idaei]|nr:hypothetical protein PI125_g10432 [Phytophthora idaei]KAG3153984.1 hypothetical protein PI126_g9843 [Phytophthora idaei]KAG3239731.1 hypothetical protein PI124_g15346 [Phytophthora idaei]